MLSFLLKYSLIVSVVSRNVNTRDRCLNLIECTREDIFSQKSVA